MTTATKVRYSVIDRTAALTITLLVESGMVCSSCEWASESDEDCENKYECGSCGTEFLRSESSDGDSNRCPNCNKFGAVLYTACPECGDEVGPGDVIVCPACDEFVNVEHVDIHYRSCSEDHRSG